MPAPVVDRPIDRALAVTSPDPAVPVPRWRHVPALDGLRGTAVAGVVAYHFGYLRGGYLGVDLFFVLSGYLITGLMLDEAAETGGVSLSGFWARRVRRLLPALLVMLAVVTVIASAKARPVDLPGLRAEALATLAYLANWWAILDGTSYWDQALAPSPLRHTWSLSIEEQFYLAWPLLVALVVRRRSGQDLAGGRRVAVLGVAGLATSALAFVVLRAAGVSPTRLYEGTDTRSFALFLGALVACWARGRRSGPGTGPGRTVQIAATAGPAAMTVLVVMWLSVGGRSPVLYRGALHAASALGAVVIAAVVVDERGDLDLTRCLSASWLRGLGRWSYGIYLWHWPVAVLVDPVSTGHHGVVLLAMRIVLTLALAVTSFVLVEEPIRRGRVLRGQPGRNAAIGGLVGVVGLVLVTTAGGVEVDAPSMSRAQTRAGAEVPSVLVVGDSVAASIAAYPVADPASFDANISNGAWIGCSVLQDGRRVRGDAGDVSRPEGCRHRWPGLVADRHPDVAVVLFGGPPTAGIEIGGTFRRACDASYRALLAERLAEGVATLSAKGARVVLVTGAHSTNPFRVPAADEAVSCANEIVRSVARSGPAALVDLDRHLCPGGTCRKASDGEDIRPDDLHFSGPGGAATARWLIRSALEVAREDR